MSKEQRDELQTCSLCGSSHALTDWEAKAFSALVASARELRETCKAAMRSMDDACAKRFIAEIERLGIADGVGIRADAALAPFLDPLDASETLAEVNHRRGYSK
jgi:hypothetical protein